MMILWLWIGGCFIAAGFVKGVTGMGLPTIAMGLLGLAMQGSEAAALLVLPSLVTNVWQTVAGPRLLGTLNRLLTMQLGVVLGTFLTIGFLAGAGAGSGAAAHGQGLSAELGPLFLGVVLSIYALTGLFAVGFVVPAGLEMWLSPLIGLLTGLLTGATGVFVIPAVPYLAALVKDKEELIQSLGLSFTVSTLALGAGLASHGAFSMQQAGGSLLALAPAMGGMLLGQALRDRLQPETFRRWFFAGLLGIGISMVGKAMWMLVR